MGSAYEYDVIVVGSGIAGLVGALAAAVDGRVSWSPRGRCASSSYLAQGGVAAATRLGDSPELHAGDTLRAGRGLSRSSAVEVLTQEAPARIADLVDLGVAFDDEPGLEGGHSRPRVFSVDGAATGERIAGALADAVLAEPRIDVSEDEVALDLWVSDGRCVGLVTDRGSVHGAGGVARHRRCSGAVAADDKPAGCDRRRDRAGVSCRGSGRGPRVRPVPPDSPRRNGFLLSEALRGAGALLVDDEGESFTDELAPRDVVARAVGARDVALLDLRPIDRSQLPGLDGALADAGFRPGDEPVPVAPAAHYTMGGVVTDLAGRDGAARSLRRRASVPARACTARTGLRPTRCSSASSSAAAPRSQPPRSPRFRRLEPKPVPGPATRPLRRSCGRRSGSDAGLSAIADGLERLTSSTHLLARSSRERAGTPRKVAAVTSGSISRTRTPRSRAAHRPRVRAASRSSSRGADGCRRPGGCLAEDVGDGDLTTEAVVPARRAPGRARCSRSAGVVCGLEVASAVFARARPGRRVRADAAPTAPRRRRRAGSPGSKATRRALLTGERPALNLLGRLCGIATLTRRYVDAVAGTGATILDTRKTTPGPARAREVRRPLRRRRRTTASASTTRS